MIFLVQTVARKPHALSLPSVQVIEFEGLFLIAY
jgi:hypothetical protein